MSPRHKQYRRLQKGESSKNRRRKREDDRSTLITIYLSLEFNEPGGEFILFLFLGLHLEGEPDLVAGFVELGSVNGRGEGESDAVTELLLVAQANLTRQQILQDSHQKN
jgi:hypothetical protein